jgi:hypothetical protein
MAQRLAFSKLKTLIRKQAARTVDVITQAVGGICRPFSIKE